MDFNRWLGDLTDHLRETKADKPDQSATTMVMVLSEQAEMDYFNFGFDYESLGCTCFINPPCAYCTHPGNPTNLEATDTDCWVEVPENLVEDRTTYEDLFPKRKTIKDMVDMRFSLVDMINNEKLNALPSATECPDCDKVEMECIGQSFVFGSVTRLFQCPRCMVSRTIEF